MKTLVMLVLLFVAPFAQAQSTQPLPNPVEIIAEGVVAMVVGPFAIMYATGTGVFSANRAKGYEDVCAAIQGKWISGTCVGGSWLNVIGPKPK